MANNSRQSPSELAENYHLQLGLAASAMTRSSLYCEYPIACLAVWTVPAIRHKQIHFFFDLSGQLTGYITWAYLAEDTERRLLTDPEVLFHISEWNEGDRLWIMDFVALDGNIRELVREAYDLFPDTREARSLRRRADGSIRKIVRWRRPK